MASLGTSSQSTRTRISLNSFLCYTGNLVNVGQTDSLPNLIKCVVVYRSYSYALWSTSLWAPGNTSNRISTSWMNAQLVREVGTQSVILMRDFVQIHIHMQTCTIGLTLSPVFPPKGGNMVLPHPLVLLPHPLIFKFILKNNTD